MSINNGIVSDGLVLHLDQNNIKSYPGEPTTNLLDSPLDLSSGWIFNNLNMSVESGEYIQVETTTSENDRAYDIQSPATDTVTFSVEIRPFELDHSSLTGLSIREDGNISVFTRARFEWNGQYEFSDYDSTDFTTQSNNVEELKNGWWRLTLTVTGVSSSNSYWFAITPNRNVSNDNTNNYKIQIRKAQAEDKDHRTNFVEGTRSSTDGWKDLSPENNNGNIDVAINYDSDQKMNFDGANGNGVNIGNPSSLQITESQTINMWIYPFDFSNRYNPYAKAYGGEGTITQEQDGDINYYYGTSGSNSNPFQGFRSNSPLTVNEWNNVCVVRDLNQMRLFWFIDGQQDNVTGANYYTATAGSRDLRIGSGYTTDYNGYIDHVSEYNRALSPSEVLANYNALKSRYGK